MTLISFLHQADDYKAAWDALDRSEDDPETVITLASAYVEKLLHHGKTLVHVEHLHVGYWIDKLTIALVRLKRWEEAEVWLERFFALPEGFQNGSGQSEQDEVDPIV